jgi:hypothetical protein
VTVLLSAAGLLVALALLWAGLRGFEWSTPLKAVLSVLDLLALALTTAQLGWLGIALLVGANVLGFLAWGVAGSIYVDAELTAGAALSQTPKGDLRRVYERLQREGDLKVLGPRRQARVVRLLADRARTAQEIEVMGPVVGAMWTITDQPDLEWLVDTFDAIVRLWGKSATEAEEVADLVVAAAQNSAGTVAEMLDGLVAAGGGTAMQRPRGPRRAA